MSAEKLTTIVAALAFAIFALLCILSLPLILYGEYQYQKGYCHAKGGVLIGRDHCLKEVGERIGVSLKRVNE